MHMKDRLYILRNIPILWEGETPPETPEFPPALEIGAQAVSSAILGGINGMLKEGMANIQDLQDGRLDQKQFTYRLVRKGSQTAIQQGAKAVSALTMRQGLIYAARKIGIRRLVQMSRSHTMLSVCYGIVDQGIDTFKYYQGDLDSTQYKIQTSQNVGATSGAIGGAAIGAVMGSAIPGIGTLAGACLGMIGSAGGASVGKSVGERWFQDESDDGSTQDSPQE